MSHGIKVGEAHGQLDIPTRRAGSRMCANQLTATSGVSSGKTGVFHGKFQGPLGYGVVVNGQDGSPKK